MKLIYNDSIKATKDLEDSKKRYNPTSDILLVIMITLSAMFIGTLIGGIVTGFIFAIINPNEALNMNDIMKNGNDIFMILNLIAQIFPIIACIFAFKKFQKRSNESLGFRRKKFFRDYLLGIVISLIMFSFATMICYFTGDLNITVNSNYSFKLLILFIIAWAIQGFSEELICRSILMNYFAAKKNVIFAIVLNSIIFAALHLGNNGIAALALINLFLVGVVFSLMFYITDSIWLPAAAHSFWNMAQGNIFGISVSGHAVSDTRIFTTSFNGDTILNGGSFGIEGGLACTLVLIIVLIISCLIIKNKNMIIE